tara:strand:- start:739 stop:867 length:129 start_codon:yes stop_codon:yes gene_type:complete
VCCGKSIAGIVGIVVLFFHELLSANSVDEEPKWNNAKKSGPE